MERNDKISIYNANFLQPLKTEPPIIGNRMNCPSPPHFRGPRILSSAMSPSLRIEKVNSDSLSQTLLLSAQNILRNLRGNHNMAILEGVGLADEESVSALATVVSSSSSPSLKNPLNPTDSPENSVSVHVIGKLITDTSTTIESWKSSSNDRYVMRGDTSTSPIRDKSGTCVGKLDLKFCQQRESDVDFDRDTSVQNAIVTDRCEVEEHICEPPMAPSGVIIDINSGLRGVCVSSTMDNFAERECLYLPSKMSSYIPPEINNSAISLVDCNATCTFSPHDYSQLNLPVGALSRKRSVEQFGGKARRPLPDQSAFDLSSSCSNLFADISVMRRSPRPMTLVDSTNYEPNPAPDLLSSRYNPSELGIEKVQLSLSDSNLVSNVRFPLDFDNVYLLDSGSTADVYRVKDRGGSIFYTVKRIKEHYKSERERSVMSREILNLKKVGAHHCEYIIHLVRAWEENAHFFILTDYAERGSVAHLIRGMDLNGNRFEDQTVWHVMHDVCRGLQHIHNCGLVHLDIKPANLLVFSDGVVKIGDFGLAVNAGSSEEDHEGDMRYMALELLTSSERHPPADLFSLALTLYEMCKTAENGCNGKWSLPFEGGQWQQLRDGDLRNIALPDRGKALGTTLQASMHPDPSQRPSLFSILNLPELVQSITVPDPTLQYADWPIVNPTLGRVRSFNKSMDELPDTLFPVISRESSSTHLTDQLFNI